MEKMSEEDFASPEAADNIKEDDEGPSHASLAIAAASEDNEEDDTLYEAASSKPEAPPSKRRPADENALGILREEAERELSQRRAPPSEPMETQADLGIEEISKRRTPSRALRARMAHRGESSLTRDIADTTAAATVASRAEVVSEGDYQAARRDLLPDIDEINSTLKSTKNRSGGGAQDLVAQRRGFRSGFLLMAIAAIALIFVYAQAPAIARALPGSEGTLISYVEVANAARDWIDNMIGRSG